MVASPEVGPTVVLSTSPVGYSSSKDRAPALRAVRKDVEVTKTDIDTAQDYYDSEDAFNFYKHVWGGELIHIGLYDKTITTQYPLATVEQVRAASAHSLENLLARCPLKLNHTHQVVDFGGAYGGAARRIAKQYGCKVVSVDISKKESEVARDLTKEANMQHLVTICEASVTDTGLESGSTDLVMSQDALMHCGEFRADAIREASRLLKPGGVLTFMDPMQTDDPKNMEMIYRRIKLKDMGSVTWYRKVAEEAGLEFVSFEDYTNYLAIHYATVGEILKAKRDSIPLSTQYIDSMLFGLERWQDGVNEGSIQYGILTFRKPRVASDGAADASGAA